MGNRAQVKILNEDGGPAVYLYTHDGSDRVVGQVKRALANYPNRWNDHCYLARLIFTEMIKSDNAIDSEYGFGICTEQHFDINRLVIVDPVEMHLQVIDRGTKELDISFDQFVKTA